MSLTLFETANEFVELDNRRLRSRITATTESLTNKLMAQLPPDLIKGKTILDLGSCLGAAGHHALTYSASHYTGVEIQSYCVDTSKKILSKYWDSHQFDIVQKDVEEFLDIAIAKNIKYDYVLAAGIIYGFVNIISILDKISKVSSFHIMIETITVHVTTDDPTTGIILIKNNQGMVKGNSADVYDYYLGLGSKIDLKAMDTIMSSLSFNRTEDLIFPKQISDTHDAYNDNDPEYFKIGLGVDYSAPIRYMVRYLRSSTHTKTIQEVINNDTKISANSWIFDKSVAERFQNEADTNIPSYHTVIDKCLQFANKYLQKNDKIIDVGSALGYTMGKFIDSGFTNVFGVDNSPAMNEGNKYPVICSDKLPEDRYNLVLMNWTLHFIQDKITYLNDIYNKLDNGYLILTDKTSQSEIVKDLYYDFKRSKGVSDTYIKEKEKSLVGVMHSLPVDWYLKSLRDIGFKVDILHSDMGFTTFLCRK